MRSIKSLQTGPSSLVFAILLLFWLLISRSTWKGQAAGNAKKHWPSCTACSMWCNHDAIVKPLTKHYREITSITMFHHVTQKQQHPHMSSWDVPRFLRHFVVLSQRHSDFDAWAHKVSGRFFSATQQQVKQVPGRCHYRPLGAVGIADTSILQLVLVTKFQPQHGKVKLQGMRRSTDPVSQHAVHDATMMKPWPNITVKKTNITMLHHVTQKQTHHAASNTSRSKALCFSLLPKKTEFWRLNFGMANLASTTWKEAMMRTKSFKAWCAA